MQKRLGVTSVKEILEKVNNMSSFRNLLAQRDEQNLSDFKFYGIEPQSNAQAVMLDLRFGNGNFQAFAYSYLTKIHFNPSEGIELFAADVRIFISGRNLNPIYNYLLMHRLTYIQESPNEADDTPESETFVEKIEVVDLRELQNN